MSRRQQAKRAAFASLQRDLRHYWAEVRRGEALPPNVLFDNVWCGEAVTEETVTILRQYLHPDAWEIDTKYDGDPTMPGPRRVVISRFVWLDLRKIDPDINVAVKKKAIELEQHRGTPHGDALETRGRQAREDGEVPS
jgi:hypothetical protein